jgi:predicted Zn-dependent protease
MRNRRLLTLILAGAVAAAVPARAGWDEGVAAFKAKNFSQAAREFEGVVAQRPDWSGGFLMLGRTQLLLKRNNDAVVTLRKGYDLNPNDVQLQLYLAQAYLEAQRPGEASQLLGKINVASLPKEQQSFFNQLQAKALVDSGQTDRAAAALARAAAANPNDSDLQFQYGAMALNAGDVAAAVAALEKASRLAPNDNAKAKLYIQALIRQARGTPSAANDSIYARAAEAARGLVARDGSYDNLLLLGETQLGAKQYDTAVTTFEQAAQKNETDWLPHFYSGQALTTLSRYGEAESALKRGLLEAKKAEDKARIWRQLGFVYEKQKVFDQAKTAYQNGGDSAGVARVEQNAKIAENNRQAAEEEKKVEEIKKAQEAIKKQLQNQGVPPPSPPPGR